MKLNKILLMIFIGLLAHAFAEDYFPYYKTWNPFTGKMEDCTLLTDEYGEFNYDQNDCLLFYDFWGYETNIVIYSNLLTEESMPKLPDLSKSDTYSAFQDAINAWNSTVNDNIGIFKEYDDSSENYIPVMVYDNLDEVSCFGVNSYVTIAFVAKAINYRDDYDFSGYEAYFIDYDTNVIPPLQFLCTAMYLNGCMHDFFDWVWSSQPDLDKEVDIQHNITHELGHVLGFADDYRSIGSTTTVMHGYAGQAQTRLIHNSLRRPLSVFYLIESTPGLPTKGVNNEK